jgi:anti-sigma factor RsiW
MTCREMAEFLIDYVSGTLSAIERAQFESHLGVCPDCVAYLDSYRRTIEISKQSVADPIESVGPLPDDLVRAILSAREKS